MEHRGASDGPKSQDLREVNEALEAEVKRLRSELDSSRTSRRGLLKGLGLTSLVALSAGAGALSNGGQVLATPSDVVDNSDLAGGLPAFLQLMLDGQLVEGDVTQAGREGAIEVLYYRQMAGVSTPGQTGSQRGRRQFEPIVFRKRIDKASPLIVKALANNEAAEGTIRFYRPSSSGPEEQFYTVQFQGQVASVEQYLPEVFMTGGETAVQPLEQVSIVYNEITFTFEDGEISFTLTV